MVKLKRGSDEGGEEGEPLPLPPPQALRKRARRSIRPATGTWDLARMACLPRNEKYALNRLAVTLRCRVEVAGYFACGCAGCSGAGGGC